MPRMDILAHAIYGATVCSRTGLAGGLDQQADPRPRSWSSDWTVWCAALFGMLPDAVSLGIPWLPYWLAGTPGEFFSHLDPPVITVYRYMHSLVVAFAAAGLIRLLWKPLFIPSLAWALHVCMDAFVHGPGLFQTTLFYPFSSWGPPGIRWWEHPNFILAYWAVLPITWLVISLQRKKRRQNSRPSGSSTGT